MYDSIAQNPGFITDEFYIFITKKIQRDHPLYNESLNFKLAYLIHFLLRCQCSILLR
jgi:hypothetical protein